jgi:adenylate kinase
MADLPPPGDALPVPPAGHADSSTALVPELNLILLGPPGSGKGTQAERLIEDFGLPHYSTGNMLREAVAARTQVGMKAKGFMDAGELVPDDVIIGVLLEALEGPEAQDGFLLDGFPRTVPQADALAAALAAVGREVTGVLLMDVDDDQVVRRLSGRRTCVQSGHTYHVEFDPPKDDAVCDQDGSPLVQRDDDRPETIRRRLSVYHEQTEPLVAYYEERDLLRRFDASRSPTEVHDHVRAAVATLRLADEI